MNPEEYTENFSPPGDGVAPIDTLEDEKRHAYVLDYLLKRLDASECEMERFYDRWGYAEKRVQAYIDVSDYENLLKQVNDKKGPVAVTSITVPYSYATIATIVTYLIHTFGGRKPIFGVGTYQGNALAARYMELALQYNSDHIRMIKKLFQWFYDGELYGLGVLRTEWKSVVKSRTVWTVSRPNILGIPLGPAQRTRTREQRVVFEGSDVLNVEPYMFFPDPRVPMQEVAEKGEFVFWRGFDGYHKLLSDQQDGLIKFVDRISRGQDATKGISERGRISKGQPHAGTRDQMRGRGLADAIQIDQGTVTIIPSRLGLGSSDRPEKWLFSIANKQQIIQAEPLDADHDKHPVAVIEPYTMGYGFGQPGLSDYLGPVQDTVSWFINSHIHNVRSVLNNMFIVDPSRIEMQDLKNPEPGKIIRMKRAAYGQDVSTMFQQLQVQDITRSHISDMDMFIKIGDVMSAVNDNIRGAQDSGGRKTATEVRTSNDLAASRLAAHAKLISAQGVVELAEQMSLNLQQNLSTEFMAQVVGPRGVAELMKIAPEMLVGDFYFPISDGTLPIDRVALLDVWKELYLGIAQDQSMRQQYDMQQMFEFIAELGGAQNIDRFRVNIAPPAPPGQVTPEAVQSGNAIPLGEALDGLGRGPGARLLQ